MRIHYLDAMRSILMVLGVVLHTANVYAVNGHWELQDSTTHPFFDGVVSLIRTFRMPTFFIIAGFFAQLTIDRHGAGVFLHHRAKRLIIPFAVTAATLNILQFRLQQQFATMATSGSVSPGTGQVIPFNAGHWIQHLWFLNVLVIYCALAVPVSQIASRIKCHLAPRIHLFTILVVGAATKTVTAGLLHCLPANKRIPTAFGLIDPEVLLTFLPFFLFGLWLFRNEDGLRAFSQFTPTTAFAIGLTCLLMGLPEGQSMALKQATILFRFALLQWLSCHICFSAFRILLDRPSAFFRYFSDASYTIYLFHHVLTIALAGMLLNRPWPVFAKFLLVLTVCLALTLLIHEFLVRRLAVLSFLFNGKPFPSPPPTAAGPAMLEVSMNGGANFEDRSSDGSLHDSGMTETILASECAPKLSRQRDSALM